MQIFLDTGSLQKVKEVIQWCCLEGVTTNPTLLAKEENIETIEQLKSYVLQITEIVPTVSLEVLAKTSDIMISDARQIYNQSTRFSIRIFTSLVSYYEI